MDSIQAAGLVKRFGSVVAVDGVTLNIRKGEVFGLLGPNGAGKTTLVSMLATLLRPTTGSASVNGFDTRKAASAVRKSIGMVFQESILDADLNAYANLDIYARLYGLKGTERKRRIQEAVALVGLQNDLQRKAGDFSGGMKRRLEIARGFLHSPTILFLDEPTLGLDPQSRRAVWEHIQMLQRKGITILLTTHYMEEADLLCNRVAIINEGKIIVVGAPYALKKKIGNDVIRVRLRKAVAIEKLKKVAGVQKVDVTGTQMVIAVKNAEKCIAQVLAALKKGDISEVSIHKPTLEDVFLHYAGRGLNDAQ
jgi:ABC-2 type transport system ATP-binding protein